MNVLAIVSDILNFSSWDEKLWFFVQWTVCSVAAKLWDKNTVALKSIHVS